MCKHSTHSYTFVKVLEGQEDIHILLYKKKDLLQRVQFKLFVQFLQLNEQFLQI